MRNLTFTLLMIGTTLFATPRYANATFEEYQNIDVRCVLRPGNADTIFAEELAFSPGDRSTLIFTAGGDLTCFIPDHSAPVATGMIRFNLPIEAGVGTTTQKDLLIKHIRECRKLILLTRMRDEFDGVDMYFRGVNASVTVTDYSKEYTFERTNPTSSFSCELFS